MSFSPPHSASVMFVNVKRNTDFDLSTSPIQVISGFIVYLDRWRLHRPIALRQRRQPMTAIASSCQMEWGLN